MRTSFFQKISLVFFIFLLMDLLTVLSFAVSRDDLHISPAEVDFGRSATIAISNIPIPQKDDQQTYLIHLYKSSEYITGGGLKGTVGIFVNKNKGISTCTASVRTNPLPTGQPWSPVPTCIDQGFGFFRLSGAINTSALPVDPGIPLTGYTVVLEQGVGVPEKVAKEFMIKQNVSSNASFTVSITPAQPKSFDTINIQLSNVTIPGTYKFGIGGDLKNEGQCNVGNCTLSFQIGPITTGGVAITVRDPAGNTQGTSVKTEPIISSIPTRPPTPIPPPPPCVEWTPSKDKCLAVDTAIGKINTDPVNFVKSIFAIILSLSGGVALLLIIFSGYKLMLSQGNPEKAQEAKETLTAAIVGLLFIIFSLVILQVIGVDILRIPGFVK